MRLMKTVARRVTLGLSEAKRFSYINASTFVISGSAQHVWRFKNIFAQLPTATGSLAGSSYGVEGNEIVDMTLKFKANFVIPIYQLVSNAQSLGAYGTIYCHMYIIAANDYSEVVGQGGTPPGSLTWTTYPNFGAADDPGWFLQMSGDRPTLNGNNCKVVRHWVRKYTPPPTTGWYAAGETRESFGVVNIPIVGKHKFKGKKTFEDNPIGDLDANFPRAGTLRGMNYFLLVGFSMPTIVTSAAFPQLWVDQFMYFKDP